MNKKLLIPLVILVLLIGGFGVYVSQILGKMDNVDITKTDKDLSIENEKIEKDSNVNNIALFGIDDKSNGGRGRSDSIMIASLNDKNKTIKLTSIMRDTYVDIPGRGMDKINHAYAFGGPELSMKTINQNFDMNIREFVAVDFDGLSHIIDALGGVEIDIKPNEVSHVPGSTSGPQMLDGEQALAYSRIRMTGDGDYERTQRQRLILEKSLEKALDAGITKYPKLLTTILPFVETSLSQGEIFKLGTSMFGADAKNMEQFRIPADGHGKDRMINGVYYLEPDTLETNVELLHNFIYEK